MRGLIQRVRLRLALDTPPAFTVEEIRRMAEEIRRMAEDDCRGLGTPAQREEYVAADVALAEVDWSDYGAGVHEETSEFIAANRRVVDAGHALGLWGEDGE